MGATVVHRHRPSGVKQLAEQFVPEIQHLGTSHSPSYLRWYCRASPAARADVRLSRRVTAKAQVGRTGIWRPMRGAVSDRARNALRVADSQSSMLEPAENRPHVLRSGSEPDAQEARSETARTRPDLPDRAGMLMLSMLAEPRAQPRPAQQGQPRHSTRTAPTAMLKLAEVSAATLTTVRGVIACVVRLGMIAPRR